jgi:hypothetical protein
MLFLCSNCKFFRNSFSFFLDRFIKTIIIIIIIIEINNNRGAEII